MISASMFWSFLVLVITYYSGNKRKPLEQFLLFPYDFVIRCYSLGLRFPDASLAIEFMI